MDHRALKNHLAEKKRFFTRVISAAVIFGLLVVLLIARLFYLQVYQHSLYMTLSNKNQLNVIPIEPARGLIYDRNNVLLAANMPVHSLDIIREYSKDIKKTILELSQVIPITPEEQEAFFKNARQSHRFEPVTLKSNLDETHIADFYVNQYRFPGVVINTRFMRYYPEGASVAHTIGYVGRIDQSDLGNLQANRYTASDYIGKAGIEKYYEHVLHGEVGHQQVEVDVKGKVMRVLKRAAPIPGETLYLTIDNKLQKIAQEAFGEDQGALVAIEPKTGQILAFVSQPGYDNNPFVQGMSFKAYQALNTSEEKPLYNRAIKGLYPPGSTVKPFYGLIALDSGVIRERDSIYDPGIFRVLGSQHVFRDHVKNGHGIVDLAKAIIVSCDIYFYQLALKLKMEGMDKALRQFGMGGLTGIDMNGELPGLIPDPVWKKRKTGRGWFVGDTVNSGIGQGAMLTTPLQLASAVAMLANRGELYKPTLLLKRRLQNGKIIHNTPVLQRKKILKDDRYWDIVLNAMEGVAHSGNGTALRYFGAQVPYRVAAKTGTIEVHRPKVYDGVKDQYRPKKYRNHKWFIVFAPVENPKIAMAVVVEHNSTAVQIARKVLDYYLSQVVH